MLPNSFPLLLATPGCLKTTPVIYDSIFEEEGSKGEYWTNTVQDPVKKYHDGITGEEAYKPPSDIEILNGADTFLCQGLEFFSEKVPGDKEKKVCGLIQVDAQDFMYKAKNKYPLLEVQQVIQKVGFEFGTSILGGELIVYHRGKHCALLSILQPCLFLTQHHHIMSPGQFLLKDASLSFYMVTGL